MMPEDQRIEFDEDDDTLAYPWDLAWAQDEDGECDEDDDE